jgi:hypothetical protein
MPSVSLGRTLAAASLTLIRSAMAETLSPWDRAVPG